jgi:hypothetical protein
MRREGKRVTRKAMNMNLEGWRERGQSKKIWIDCVRQDVKELNVSDEMTTDRGKKYAALT